MGDTKISWSSKVWNCVRGCSRVSAGCGGAAGQGGCYAERQAYRFSGPGQAYEGLVRLGKQGPRWTGKTRFVPEKLAEPLRWRKPARIFVNSMSDLFHEALSNEQIAAVFGVMAAAPRHIFQVLTKRPERARDWYEWAHNQRCQGTTTAEALRSYAVDLGAFRAPDGSMPPGPGRAIGGFDQRWPLPNVHMGVSVENQETARRVATLLTIPASVHWVSAEALLLSVDLADWMSREPRWACSSCGRFTPDHDPRPKVRFGNTIVDTCPRCCREITNKRIDWVVVGGESGPKARPFHLAWARDIVAQCRQAGTPCFVKQMGANAYDYPKGKLPLASLAELERGWPRPPFTDLNEGTRVRFAHRAGEDPSEWPAGLRVRQFPEAAR